MKLLHNYLNTRFLGKKRIFALGMIAPMLMLILGGCQANINPQDKDLTTVIATVYGRVMTAPDSTGIYHAKVFFLHYPEGCKSKMHREKDFTFTDEKGDYRTVYHLGGPQQKGSCLKAKIQLPDSSSYAEPAPKIFSVKFNTGPTPDDSVRIDFMIHDSTK